MTAGPCGHLETTGRALSFPWWEVEPQQGSGQGQGMICPGCSRVPLTACGGQAVGGSTGGRGGYRDQGRGCSDDPSRRDGGWAREGAVQGEKWVTCEPILKVEPPGLPVGLNVKQFLREGEESGMVGHLSA